VRKIARAFVDPIDGWHWL